MVNIVNPAPNSISFLRVDLMNEHGADCMCKYAPVSSALLPNAENLYTCKYAPMRNAQIEQILNVLQIMMDAIGVGTRSELATRAGLSHTTLTRLDAENLKPAWLPSAKTWIALSKATGVPVTFLGDKIVGGGQHPGQSYLPQDPIEIKVRNLLRLLGPEEKMFLVSVLDAVAEKMVYTKRN